MAESKEQEWKNIGERIMNTIGDQSVSPGGGAVIRWREPKTETFVL
jgi:hypothetical protein